MIRSFRDSETEALFRSTVGCSRWRVARRKLRQLHAARELRAVGIPANRLEAQAGARRGQHRIRVNGRVPHLLRLEGGGAEDVEDVEIVDYHQRSRRDHGEESSIAARSPRRDLCADLMVPLGLSINGLARDLRVPVMRMSEIVNGRRSITPDTALRLARYFSTTAQFWVNPQSAYDLDVGHARICPTDQARRASTRGGIVDN